MPVPPPYRIAPEVFAAHPGYCRGVLIVDGADNRGTHPALTQALREAEAQVRERITGNVAEHPRIVAWREAYRRFGAKPSEHRSSIEAMARRVLQPGGALPSINPLVDIGNVLSLRHLLPAGVHPLPEGPQALELRPARAGDRFVPPGGGEAEAPPPGEIVFTHGAEVLTRRWTWRQAAGTQTLPETARVFFNIDGLVPASRAEVEQVMAELRQWIVSTVGGEVRAAAVLDAAMPAL